MRSGTCASQPGVVAQEVTLQGTVADGARKPLAGATIYLQQHPRKGAISGEDGQFQLRVAREAVATDTLVVLYMGLQTVRMALREVDVSKPIARRMQSNEQQLREVVVRANPSASPAVNSASERLAEWRATACPMLRVMP